MLDNKPNQPTKFRTKKWVEINDDAHGTNNKDNQIKFKTSMLKLSLCDYSDAYMLVKGTISIAPQEGDNTNNGNKDVVFKNCVPFTDCISEINNTQIDNAKDIDVVMPIYNLTEYSDNYSKTSGSLWQYYRDEAATNAGAIANFHAANNSDSFKFKQKVTGKTVNANGKEDVEIMMSLKYLSNF